MGLAEATKRKRYALLALGILLRFPHSYEAGWAEVMKPCHEDCMLKCYHGESVGSQALFEMGFLQVMARFLSTGLPSVHDEASAHHLVGLSVQSDRAQRHRCCDGRWQSRIAAKDTSGLTARLSTRALRVDSWKNRLQAARNMRLDCKR